MKGVLTVAGVLFSMMVFSSVAFSEPGERWEVTSKMDMEGMPFAMPAQTREVCIPKGKQSDPNYTRGKENNCKMTDVKQSGNTVRFKGVCVQDGKNMEMSGETTHDGNSFKTSMKMRGEARGGESMNVALTSTGKKLGGSCDTSEQDKAMKAYAGKANAQAAAAQAQGKAAIAQVCDVSSKKPQELIMNNTPFVGAKPMCAGKKAAYCKAVNNAVSTDYDAFTMLQNHEQQIRDYTKSGTAGIVSTVQACGLNMRNIIKSQCKVHAKKGPQDFLDNNCPAEAKAFRELMRKQAECEGRAFTGVTYKEDMRKCMGGEMVERAGSSQAASAEKPAEPASAESAATSEATSEAVKQGTKALKGLFGF